MQDPPRAAVTPSCICYRPEQLHEQLHEQFGEAFTLLKHTKEAHHTPAGKVQQFVYCYCRKVNS